MDSGGWSITDQSTALSIASWGLTSTQFQRPLYQFLFHLQKGCKQHRDLRVTREAWSKYVKQNRWKIPPWGTPTLQYGQVRKSHSLKLEMFCYTENHLSNLSLGDGNSMFIACFWTNDSWETLSNAFRESKWTISTHSLDPKTLSSHWDNQLTSLSRSTSTKTCRKLGIIPN